MTKLICNMCGKELDMFDKNHECGWYVYPGYGGKYDKCAIDLDLCCDCFDKLMDSVVAQCKHDPVVDLG